MLLNYPPTLYGREPFFDRITQTIRDRFLMRRQFHRNDRKSPWNRFTSCAALTLYLFALVVIPALHGHDCENGTATCCEHSETIPDQNSVPVDSCPICEFVHLVVPFFTVSEPLLYRTDIVDEVCVVVSIPSVAHATILPPCRAPPVI